MRIRTSLALIFAFFSQLSHAQVSEKQFQEAMAVCDNMTQYVDAAKRQRSMNMSLASAKDLSKQLMEKNLKLDESIKQGAIGLALDIYDYVYAQAPSADLSTEQVLAATCGSYRSYAIPEERVAAHLATTTQSAWDPLARVSLCTKVAETISNIAVARDQGRSRASMAEILDTVLARDKFTYPKRSALLAWAYDNPRITVRVLYFYTHQQCQSEQAGKKFPLLAELSEQLIACSVKTQRPEQDACLRQTLSVSQ